MVLANSNADDDGLILRDENLAEKSPGVCVLVDNSHVVLHVRNQTCFHQAVQHQVTGLP